jgi:N-acylneuraminate cytidylyltransferase
MIHKCILEEGQWRLLMIGLHRVLAIIPARGGSKGLPRKNIRPLGGIPLIAWSIQAAQQSKYVDRIIVSTEDDEIASVARDYGGEVPFMRPHELAQDHTPGIEPVLHVLQNVSGYDLVVLLQPTSPLRTTEDIDGAIEKLLNANAPACVTVTEPDKSPYWMYRLDDQYRMLPILKTEEFVSRRQELPPVYALNGAVYVAYTEWLTIHKSYLTPETVAYPMPKSRSIDIDDMMDFEFCELLLQKSKKSLLH